MILESITNRGEFFSNHYLDAVIGNDIGDLRSRWDDIESWGEDTARSRIRSMSRDFFDSRADADEATDARWAEACRALNDVVLGALGYPPARAEVEMLRGSVDVVRVPLAHETDTGSGRLLVALDAGLVADPDEFFDDTEGSPGELLDPLWREDDKQRITKAPDAVTELFAVDEPPRYVLVVGGRVVLLAERSKWGEGRFLAVDLDAALERRDIRARGELETIAALFSADALVPEEGQSVFDELVESSHKHAVGVSKDLRDGIRQSVEILANEVIEQRLAANLAVYSGPNAVDPKALTRQCLRWLYRLLVLLYAESRPELGVLPVNDDAYLDGYSLDRLRQLCLVPLDSDRARQGSHIHESLQRLFDLVNEGYHQESAQQAFTFDAVGRDEPSTEEYLQFPGLDAALFDENAAPLLDSVTLRNEALQKVLAHLMLSPEGKTSERGFISYAQLGINQLGAVYEGLMAYSGFFAHTDLFEVAKGGDPTDGTWVLPVDQADGYPEDVFVSRTDPVTGRAEYVRHPRGSFVFRLSGRDRQRSASYYTPEVLTQCVVKHALAELLGLDDYAPENGSSGITEARQILDITICEPALGSGAFLNEAINQLSAEYLRRRMIERDGTLDPEEYRHELQKVKAHFALHQCYGVDLNATAVELAEVSLWLNCMHPGLKAPWFGLQLRRGNSLIGCRRATWRVDQLRDQPWANTKKGQVVPPVDRKLSDGPLNDDEIHHFLLPGHGWAAVADRKEAKELRPDEVTALKEWRKTILKAPSTQDTPRLQQLAQSVETLWAIAAQRIGLTQQALRRPIDVYGAQVADEKPSISRGEAERILADPDSALNRLRTLMDAWVGLWFWPVDAGVQMPSWNEWLTVAGELLAVDQPGGPRGQLGFDDLEALLDAERSGPAAASVAEIRDRHPWLAVAIDAARAEGAWHWELELAPVFQQGGFDLQVGNPPWVKLEWKEEVALAEFDPWWGVSDRTQQASASRRKTLLAREDAQTVLLQDMSNGVATARFLTNPHHYPLMSRVSTNLYLFFIENAFWQLCQRGISGLIHQEIHLTTPRARPARRRFYKRCRRHFHFRNELKLFEDVKNNTTFSINVLGSDRAAIRFLHGSWFFVPRTIDESIAHNAAGPLPGFKDELGNWDTRPHALRLVEIRKSDLAVLGTLTEGSQNTDPEAVRLLSLVTSSELGAVEALAAYEPKFATAVELFDHGIQPNRAIQSGAWADEQCRPSSVEDLILLGGHIDPCSVRGQEPNIPFRNSRDWIMLDVERLSVDFIPISNYTKLSRDIELTLGSSIDGKPFAGQWRLVWRRRVDQGGVRLLSAAIVPPYVSHNHSVHAITGPIRWLATCLGMFASIPVEYIARVLGRDDLTKDAMGPLPVADRSHNALSRLVVHRALRMMCLTQEYASLWTTLFDPAWATDEWTAPSPNMTDLYSDDPSWSRHTGLRRDAERRLALVELDALAALMLGLTAEQLCAMYRTQFAVLRKYEHKMVFDAEGRKICGYHQSAGYRQAQLQEHATAGDLPKAWTSLWSLYEQYEADPSSVDWMGHYTPPFYRPDREKEMTRAYEEFSRRLDEGIYG